MNTQSGQVSALIKHGITPLPVTLYISDTFSITPIGAVEVSGDILSAGSIPVSFNVAVTCALDACNIPRTPGADNLQFDILASSSDDVTAATLLHSVSSASSGFTVSPRLDHFFLRPGYTV